MELDFFRAPVVPVRGPLTCPRRAVRAARGADLDDLQHGLDLNAVVKQHKR